MSETFTQEDAAKTFRHLTAGAVLTMYLPTGRRFEIRAVVLEGKGSIVAEFMDDPPATETERQIVSSYIRALIAAGGAEVGEMTIHDDTESRDLEVRKSLGGALG